jgi:hypothetical protein
LIAAITKSTRLLNPRLPMAPALPPDNKQDFGASARGWTVSLPQPRAAAKG